jgi:hypothetical protein
MVQLVLNRIINAALAIPEAAADHHWVRIRSAE